MEIQICTVCGREFEWSPEWYAAKGLQCPPLRCPTCADVRLGKDDHHTVAKRECLLEFPCCDVSQAVGRLHFTTVEEQDGRRLRAPYRRATIKGKAYGASWSGRIDVFDQRTDSGGELARVRIMRTQHQAGAILTGKHSGQAVLAVVDEDHPLTARRMHDRGALHKGDLLTLATAPDWAAQALLMKKADKPVETETTVWPRPPQGEEGDR